MIQHTPKQTSTEQAKQPYAKPELTVHGAVEVETKANIGGSKTVVFLQK